MFQKHKNGSTVFNWYFDLDSSELKCQYLTITRWDYMDGMQWEVIDEYELFNEVKEPYFKFFKKLVKHRVRLPGYLISPNKLYAKLLFVDSMVKSFGYMLSQDTVSLCSQTTYISVSKAANEYRLMIEEYPELVVKVLGEFKPEKTNSGWIWGCLIHL